MNPIGGRSDIIGDDPDEWASQEDGFQAAAEAAAAVATALGTALAMVNWDGPAGLERRERLHRDAADADRCAEILHGMASTCREIADHAAAAIDDLDRLRLDYDTAPDDDRPRILAEVDERAARHVEVTAPLRHRLGLLALELDPVISRGDPLQAYFSPVTPDDPQGAQVVDAGLVTEYLHTGVLADR